MFTVDESSLFEMLMYCLSVCPQAVNRAMVKKVEELTIGVLDIYGFEIFMVCACVLQYTVMKYA